MVAPDPPIAASFLEDNREWITAVATFAASVVIAHLVDRSVQRRGDRISGPGGGLSPVADTRLRLVRRLITATIVVVGLALALSQFEGIQRVATGVLASSAVLGLVVGFAARQVLANAVAGILLAITQPLRIGDVITFEEETGTVEDVRLTYTFVRAGDGRRVIIPNERLAQSTIHNHTITDPKLHAEVSVWIPPWADVGKALAALSETTDVDVEVAEQTPDGIRLVAGTWVPTANEKASLEAGIRASCLERLRVEGLSWEPGSSAPAR